MGTSDERVAKCPATGRSAHEAEAIEQAAEKLWETFYPLHTGAREILERRVLGTLRLFPDPRDATGNWPTMAEILAAPQSYEQVTSGVDAFEKLRVAWAQKDPAALVVAAGGIKKAQRELASEAKTALLSDGMVALELLYYRVDFRLVGLLIFSLASLLYGAHALAPRFLRKRVFLVGAVIAVTAGILWNSWIVGGHTALAGRLPLKNLHEVFLVVLFFLPLIGVLLQGLLRNALYGGVAAGLSVVGFVGSATYEFLPPIIREFREKFPSVKLDLREISSFRQQEELLKGNIDIGILHPPLQHSALHMEKVQSSPCILALPKQHPLTAKQTIDIQDLKNEPIITLSMNE